ncbi:rhodanese-like domain-containing protein [Mycobacterium sp. CBMA271]|uniref:rhodanese-like domain-containing protein n=1 Tax=unclassified Mycobacteroides TaxID=2618759 RepID=UPI0012DD3FD9|nr:MULTISPECIES: rhodanese-like domain-containing protein [unclassified Mycobacteroides]MUM18055.1 sulfurtransferase [Mycobacteroides sp. CBMA 326]MUM23464.1 rhodanese-like domain-containing protein [Mycobacteroides sp. CBMA 271]
MNFPSGDEVPQVGIEEISAALDLGVKLLDVREDDEWAAGHIDGAQHIPLGDVPSRMDELDSDAPLWVICHAGGRSQRAAAYLNRNGFDVSNVSGGMLAWVQAGKPTSS